MKLIKCFLVLALSIFIVGDLAAQYRGRYFWVSPGVGATNYKGDLDSDFSLKFTKPGLGVMGGYQFNPHMSVRLSVAQGWMKATDTRTDDLARNRRNLSFRSPITEAALTAEWKFFGENRSYKFRPKYSPFVFAGVAVFRFNPQAKLGGQWYDLQPLGTEGQNLPGAGTVYPERYKLVQVSIPMGVGVRYKLGPRLDLCAEIGLRKTFTDYLDDVSGEYPDLNELRADNPIAAELSDRIDLAQYPEGAAVVNGIRGDKTQDDWYVLSFVSVRYILDWVKCPKFR